MKHKIPIIILHWYIKTQKYRTKRKISLEKIYIPQKNYIRKLITLLVLIDDPINKYFFKIYKKKKSNFKKQPKLL